MDALEITTTVKEIISEWSDIDLTDIETTSKLEDDLGLDSLDALEIATELEIAFDLEEIPAAKLQVFETVGDVVQYIVASQG